MTGLRRAFVVVGGGSAVDARVVEQGEVVAVMLVAQGFEVEWCAGPAPFADAERLSRADLVVDIAAGAVDAEGVAGLRRAVLAGTGLVGWPGGVAEAMWAEQQDASSRESAGLRSAVYGLGRVFVADPGEGVLDLDDRAARHAVETGLLWASAPVTA